MVPVDYASSLPCWSWQGRFGESPEVLPWSLACLIWMGDVWASLHYNYGITCVCHLGQLGVRGHHNEYPMGSCISEFGKPDLPIVLLPSQSYPRLVWSSHTFYWRFRPVYSRIPQYSSLWWPCMTASHYSSWRVWSTGSPVALAPKYDNLVS